jgi:hypothetical protein
MLIQAERLVGRTANGEIVSQALWCDQGGHAFSARDPKSEHWARTVTDPKTGEKAEVPWDVCGLHMAAIDSRLAQLEAEAAAPPAPRQPPQRGYGGGISPSYEVSPATQPHYPVEREEHS